MAPRRIGEVSSKPNTEKKLRVRVEARGVRAEMGKVKEEQECLRDEQSELVARFDDIARHCDQLREETKMIVKQSAITRAKLLLMFRIFKAREIGDLVQAAELTRILREIVAMESSPSVLDGQKSNGSVSSNK